MIVVKTIGSGDDLKTLVQQINTARWDNANDMSEYAVDALHSYLQKPDTLFIACYYNLDNELEFSGMASARLEMKPYDHESWLYIDEIDVCLDQRRRGAATAMMNYLLEFASDNGCAEVWLGTGVDNSAARALYKSLEPDEEVQLVGYTYEVEETEFA